MFTAPWAVYYAGLRGIVGRPEQSAANRATDAQLELLRAELRVPGDLTVPVLSPWDYVLTFAGYPDRLPRSTMAAWVVARSYNYPPDHRARVFSWHLSGAALMIWLTRNWTSDQILARAAELLESQRRPSNPTLEPAGANGAAVNGASRRNDNSGAGGSTPDR